MSRQEISSREIELMLSDEICILKHIYNALSHNKCDRVNRISAQFGPDHNAICIVLKDGTKRILTLKTYEGEEDEIHV